MTGQSVTSFFLGLALALTAPGAGAEQMQRLGNYEAHYVVVGTTFLSEQVAERHRIVRGRDRALVNLSVLDPDGTPVAAKVSGTSTNLLGQITTLSFREVREGSAIYYLAPIRFTDRETLRFRILVDISDGETGTLEFQQEMFLGAPGR